MLHDESFAMGLAIGRKMGGTTDDSAAMAYSTGGLCDIWTIPIYEQSDTVTATEARKRRFVYCVDIMERIYGAEQFWMEGDDFRSIKWSIDYDYYDASDRSTYTVLQDQPITGYTANWATVPARLLVSPSIIAIILLDDVYDTPVIWGGFLHKVRHASSGSAIRGQWESITPSQQTWPNSYDQVETKIDDFGMHLGQTSLMAIRRYKGQGGTLDSSAFTGTGGYVRNMMRYNSVKGLTADAEYEHPFDLRLFDAETQKYYDVYEFVGGAKSFGTCCPAESTTFTSKMAQAYMHITSYMRAGQLFYYFLKLPQYMTAPTMRGLLPPDMCTYPHTAIDDTPGSWGQGYEQGKADGYGDGYAAGETAGKEEGKQEGYDEGHEAGYSEGQIAGYESGYQVGEQAGYDNGYTAGETAGHEAGYQEGYQAGYQAGKTDGYDEGYAAGETAGHDKGYQEGYDAGETAGHDAGYAEGYTAGEAAGHAAGYQEGYAAGYDAGKADGYQEGYEAGYQAAQAGDTPQPPADGLTHIVVDVGPIDRTLELLLVVTGPKKSDGDIQLIGVMDVTWGDEYLRDEEWIDAGTTQTMTLTHTYDRAGTYEITIKAQNITIELGHGGNINGIVGQGTSSSTSIPVSVRSIAIGSGVTGIAEYALAHLRGCKSIYIPDGVTIGRYAMRMCYSLTAVRLPSDLLEIPNGCFYDCTSLASIDIPQTVTTIAANAFYGCSSLRDITIPDGVTSIGSSAFYECAALKSFAFPGGVTSLPSSCFRGCRSLAGLTLSPTTATIGGYALYSTAALESLEVPETVTKLSDYAVYSANGLRWMRMRPTTPPTTTQYTFSSIPSGLKFIVPDGCGEAYRTATRWKTYASRIYEESEVSW